MKTDKNNPKMLMKQLVERAQVERLFSGSRNSGKPGELIENLGIIKRQILKELKPQDIQNVRYPE